MDEWRNPGYRHFLHEHGRCIVAAHGGCQGPIDPAHTEHGGMSQKGADSSCVPLCRAHHRQADGQDPLPGGLSRGAGKAAFEAFYGVALKREAQVWWLAFQIYREADAA